MFRDQKRYGRDPGAVTRCADSTFLAPVRSRKWAEHREACIADHGHHLVFTCSWSDFFHPDADPWREEAWDVIRRTPRSTYQVLTKRPELIPDRLPPDWGNGWPNVWLGTSIENRRFVGRADLLRAVPAAARFISAEPLLGPLIGPRFPGSGALERVGPAGVGAKVLWGEGARRARPMEPELNLRDIDLLIVGGESGPRHRPIAVEWVRELRDAALAMQEVGWRCSECGWRTESHEELAEKVNHTRPSGTLYMKCPRCEAEGSFVDWNISGPAFFFKQWGGPRPESGGRKLDGREWSELPEWAPRPEVAA